jgi:F-type H+-transporting ATPase subunit b
MVVLAFAEGSGIQLVPDGTIIIHIALILVMIWVLNRTFFRPINRVLASRDRNKGGHSAEAQGIMAQVSEKSKKYDEEMRRARLEGYQLVEAERAEALAKRQAEIESVKQEVEQTVSQEKDSIERQAEEARATIAAEAQKMAEKISSNILRG